MDLESYENCAKTDTQFTYKSKNKRSYHNMMQEYSPFCKEILKGSEVENVVKSLAKPKFDNNTNNNSNNSNYTNYSNNLNNNNYSNNNNNNSNYSNYINNITNKPNIRSHTPCNSSSIKIRKIFNIKDPNDWLNQISNDEEYSDDYETKDSSILSLSNLNPNFSFDLNDPRTNIKISKNLIENAINTELKFNYYFGQKNLPSKYNGIVSRKQMEKYRSLCVWGKVVDMIKSCGNCGGMGSGGENVGSEFKGDFCLGDLGLESSCNFCNFGGVCDGEMLIEDEDFNL